MKIDPPDHLSDASKQLFREVLEHYELELHHQRLLTLLCEAFDRGAAAQAVITADGLVVEDRYGRPKVHPAVTVKRDADITAARLLRELDLDADPTPDTRVPRR